jgi:hypothetical protein
MKSKFSPYLILMVVALVGQVFLSPLVNAQTAEFAKAALPTPQTGSVAVEPSGPRVLSFEEQIYQRMISDGSDRITYGDKYALTCHIYTYSRQFLSVSIVGLSTYKSTPCDPRAFRRLTAASITAQIAPDIPHDYVVEAGPHVQLMDSNKSPLQQRFISVGSLDFAPVSIAVIGIEDVFVHFSSWKRWISNNMTYTPIYMNNNSFFAWYGGSIVYKIITDEGRVFVMTHAAVDYKIMSQQDLDDQVADLGAVLNLPAGWRYEAQTLTRILSILERNFDHDPPAKMADEFGNLYIEIKSPIR